MPCIKTNSSAFSLIKVKKPNLLENYHADEAYCNKILKKLSLNEFNVAK